MKLHRRGALVLPLGACLLVHYAGIAGAAPAADPLPSWNDGANKHAILEFVRSVTEEGLPTFVRPLDRVATFDNDGTLWVEQPLYVEGQFVLDRARELAADHPEWKQQQPFRGVLEGGPGALASLTHHDIATLIAATHSGMTTDAFEAGARRWLATAKHPRFGRLYKELTYQPMIELLEFLRANGFRTYIVSGGGADFLRANSEQVYGIPPGQVIGSTGKLAFETRGGKSVLIKLPEVTSIDDKQGKPINIRQHVGQRPILAFGNSDGDLQMLQYTASGDGPRLMLLLHHDDKAREYAYDRTSHIGMLDAALDAAHENGWNVVSMKSDWNQVFAAPRTSGAAR
jgi:phosphoglycolate phosphatase-like HAD superfamily hydrolase